MAQKITKPSTPIKTSSSAAAPKAEKTRSVINLTFDKGNYTWFIISIAVVVLGFILMSGTTDIYSTTKIVIAPVVVLAGFGLGFYAIFKKPVAKS